MLDQKERAQLAGGVLSDAAAIGDGTGGENAILTGDASSTAELLGIKQDEPNLIEDITSDVLRLSQRRLEQMVALDEEQAANVLKTWMRERAAA